MRYSKLFGKTRYSAPADADSVNARLLTQGGFIEKQAAGIYNFLPLGLRVLGKVNNIIRDEMNKVDGQEIFMPVLHSREIWKATGRDQSMDGVLYRTRGTDDQEFVLGPSHEEVVTPLVKTFIKSYKDLPLAVYQIQTKFRNEPRAKSGVLRGREFGMKDMYSFHLTEEDLDAYYDRCKIAYTNVYERCGLKSYMIEASGGAFSDKFSHEFSILTPAGEDTILICDKCGAAQNIEIAQGKYAEPEDFGEDGKANAKEKPLPMKEVEAKRGPSIEAGCELHGCPAWKILKTVVYEVEDDGLVGICIRGDLQINELKVEKYFKKQIRPASPEMLKKAGLVQGFIGPVNMPAKVKISFIGDHSIKNVTNIITGANAKDVDIINVNIGTDYTVEDFADFVQVRGSFKCGKCGGALREEKAIEAGNIFKLGTKFTDAVSFTVTNKDQKQVPVFMGCYGIGNTRLVGTIVEACHDENGIIWPKSVAPYHVHLITLGNDEEATKKADKLYEELTEAGIEVLYDDRTDSAGVKFKDSDLIGLPLRIVISKRTLERDSVEWKERAPSADGKPSEAKNVAFKDVVKEVVKFVKD